jgi:hypothetical protein
MHASASRTFFALVEPGTLIAYNAGADGPSHVFRLELREWTGVIGGDIGEVDWFVDSSRLGVARYTSLQAPTPIGLFCPFPSIWIV